MGSRDKSKGEVLVFIANILFTFSILMSIDSADFSGGIGLDRIAYYLVNICVIAMFGADFYAFFAEYYDPDTPKLILLIKSGLFCAIVILSSLLGPGFEENKHLTLSMLYIYRDLLAGSDVAKVSLIATGIFLAGSLVVLYFDDRPGAGVLFVQDIGSLFSGPLVVCFIFFGIAFVWNVVFAFIAALFEWAFSGFSRFRLGLANWYIGEAFAGCFASGFALYGIFAEFKKKNDHRRK